MNGKRPDSYREVLGAVKTQIWKFSRHIVVSSFGRWFCSLAHGKGPDRSTSSHRSRVQSMKRVHWRQHRRGMSIPPVIAAKGQSITPAAHVGSNLSPVRSSQASTLPAGQREHCSLLPKQLNILGLHLTISDGRFSCRVECLDVGAESFNRYTLYQRSIQIVRWNPLVAGSRPCPQRCHRSSRRCWSAQRQSRTGGKSVQAGVERARGVFATALERRRADSAGHGARGA